MIPSLDAAPALPLAPLSSGPADRELDELKGASPAEVGRRFEGLFASLLLSEMKKTLPSGSFFGGGQGADVYDGMLERTLGDRLAEGSGLGIGDFIERNLQEKLGDVSMAAAKEEAR